MNYVPTKSPLNSDPVLRGYLEREFQSISRALVDLPPAGSDLLFGSLEEWAETGGSVRLVLSSGVHDVASEISFPDGTEIVGDPGATINATGLDYNVFRALGSFKCTGVAFSRTDAATNTSYKAIHADDSLASLPNESRIVIRDCIFAGFDIGIYVDGGSSQQVSYAEVSGSRVVINTLGTGGGSSVRPTIGLNNCNHAVIKDNPLLDASDSTNPVNNIYCLGSSKIDVVGNTLRYGQAVKILSNPTNAVEHMVLQRNRIISPTIALLAQVDEKPIRTIELTDNTVESPRPGVNEGCFYFGILNIVTGAKAFEAVIGHGNRIKSCTRNVWFVSMDASDTFGSLSLSSNVYYDTSNGSVGTYAVVNQSGTGTYDELCAIGETVQGNNVTRAYEQVDPLNFTNQVLTAILEVEVTG